MRMRCLLTFAGFLITGCARGGIYYVATDGDDANPGSPDAPFRTLNRGAQLAVAGDTVIVRDGTYGHENALTDGVAADTNRSPVVLRNSGNAAAWITFQAEHQWGAILDCEMQCDSYFNLANSSYIVIQGFVIRRGYREGIHSNDAAHHITLRGNRIENIGNRTTSSVYGLDGLYTNPNCHDFLIDRNVFHDIGRTDINWLDHALYLRGSNFTVVNNIFYNLTRGWAIQMADGLSNVLIANNTFAFANPYRNGQIMMWNAQSGVTIVNNIFYNPRGYAIARFQSSVSACTIDHNLVYGAPAIIADSSGCAFGANFLNADPQFVNAVSAPYDFHLLPGSPGAGAGVRVDGLNRPQGPLSIGAVQ